MSYHNFSIKIVLTLFTLTLVTQQAFADNPYQLSPNKQQMETCERESLQLHAGEVEQERIFHQQNRFEVRYEIQTKDGLGWSVLCDLNTGKIIGEQKMLGN